MLPVQDQHFTVDFPGCEIGASFLGKIGILCTLIAKQLASNFARLDGNRLSGLRMWIAFSWTTENGGSLVFIERLGVIGA